MRTVFAALVMLLAAVRVDAQSGRRAGQPAPMDGCPKVYLGTGTGLEHPTGLLGVNMDLAFHPSVSLGGGIGLSSWGTKLAIEGRYYYGPCNRGLAIGAGLTTSSGGRSLARLATIDYGEVDVAIYGGRVSNLFVSAYYFLKLGKAGHRFYLQTGYSHRLTELKYTTGIPITASSEEVVKALAPGGLMAGLGFSLAIGQ